VTPLATPRKLVTHPGVAAVKPRPAGGFAPFRCSPDGTSGVPEVVADPGANASAAVPTVPPVGGPGAPASLEATLGRDALWDAASWATELPEPVEPHPESNAVPTTSAVIKRRREAILEGREFMGTPDRTDGGRTKFPSAPPPRLG
jgi:hypothetical protein